MKKKKYRWKTYFITANRYFRRVTVLLSKPMAQGEAGQEKPGTKVDLGWWEVTDN